MNNVYRCHIDLFNVDTRDRWMLKREVIFKSGVLFSSKIFGSDRVLRRFW